MTESCILIFVSDYFWIGWLNQTFLPEQNNRRSVSLFAVIKVSNMEKEEDEDRLLFSDFEFSKKL